MSSVTNSRVCCLPLWTMNVEPTNSGTIVQSRAQVRIGSRLLPCRSTFRSSRGSTCGPFFSERLIARVPHIRLARGVPRASPTAADDRLVGRLPLLAGLAALGQHAGRAARVPAAGGPALAAAHRVADRVHRHAAVVRLAALPALAPGLAQTDGHVFGVGDRADRGPAVGADAADLAGRQRDLRPVGLAGGQGRAAPGGAADLPSAA